MSDNHDGARIRDHFLAWRCRIREHAMRHHGGRPSPGIRPRVARPDGTESAAAVTVLLVDAGKRRGGNVMMARASQECAESLLQLARNPLRLIRYFGCGGPLSSMPNNANLVSTGRVGLMRGRTAT